MAVFDSAGRSLLPRVRKTRAVLALLAMAMPRPVLRDELTALLWSRRDREQARASLRQSVHELHDALLPVDAAALTADRHHLTLSRAGVWVDVHELARATTSRPGALSLAVTTEPPAALLRDLVGLDPAFDRWLEAERRRIMRAAAEMAEAVLAAAVGPAATVEAAGLLVALDPTRESGWRAMMAAQAQQGDRAAAAATFERCSAALAEAAHMPPSAETCALLDSIRRQLPAGPSSVLEIAPAAPVQATPAAANRDGAENEGAARVGVRPFRLLDAEGDSALSFGLAEDISTALSRFRHIALITSISLEQIDAGTDPARRQVELDSLRLDFLIDGTIQRGDGRVRVIVRLLELHAPGGSEVIWARRFDRSTTDLLALQDEIAGATVAQIDPELMLREGRRSASLAPRDAAAYDLLLRAIPAVYRLEETAFRAAGDMLEAAVALDPDFAAAHAWWAYWHVFLVGQGWAGDARDAMMRAGALAERAIQLDPSDARALAIAGHVRAFLHRRLDEAMALHDRALALNPNLPLAWALSGLAKVYAGEHDEAVRRIEQARRLSPFDPHAFFVDMALTLPLYMQGRFEAVVEIGRRVTALHPSLSSTYKGYLAALGQLVEQGHAGLVGERDEVRRRLLAMEPNFTVAEALARSPLSSRADRAAYAEGLRHGGLPEQIGHDDAPAIMDPTPQEPRNRLRLI